jgi:hypothetical protein
MKEAPCGLVASGICPAGCSFWRCSAGWVVTKPNIHWVPPTKSSVDRTFVGDFTMNTGEVTIDDNGVVHEKEIPDKAFSLVIRNLDGHQYYVELAKSDQKDEAPLRMVGYTADVNGVTFANLRELTDDGVISNKHWIMRISISPDGSKLTIRDLNDKFFADKNIDSQAALKNVIQANLETNQMYAGKSAIATRVAAAGK